VLATNTDSTLGLGKWQFAPIVGPIWFFPRRKGFVLLRLHEHVSFAGDTIRPDVNYFKTGPYRGLDLEAASDALSATLRIK